MDEPPCRVDPYRVRMLTRNGFRVGANSDSCNKVMAFRDPIFDASRSSVTNADGAAGKNEHWREAEYKKWIAAHRLMANVRVLPRRMRSVASSRWNLPPVLLTPGSSSLPFERRGRHVIQ